MVESFVDALDVLTTQGETQVELKFLEVENSVKGKLNQIFAALNQRRCRKEPVLEIEEECIEKEEEQDVSTQFFKKQKIQTIDLQDHSRRYSNLLLVFAFNSAKEDTNLIKSYLLPLLVIERGIEPIVTKKANQFVHTCSEELPVLIFSSHQKVFSISMVR